MLSKILNRVYQKVKSPAAAIVTGPVPISLNEILDPATNEPDPLRFIERYVPTIRALLATYPFLDLGAGPVDVNDDPAVRNDLLLDLNDGFDLTGTIDPIPFADLTTTTVIYGTNVSTPTVAQQQTRTDRRRGDDRALHRLREAQARARRGLVPRRALGARR